MATAPATGETGERAPANRLGRMAARAALLGRRAARVVRPDGRAAGAVRPRHRVRLLDVLRIVGLARRAVPRPVVGPKAYVQWWQRVLALVVLVAMMVGIGFVLAAAVGLMVVVAGFLLEQAIA